MKTRLDVAMVSRGLISSRQQARTLILEEKVKLCSKICTKPSSPVCDDDPIEIVGELPKYVGRGGKKLEYALKTFNISVSGKKCLDIGASTGGFTDCMLQSGADFVFAVDVGTGQLADCLKSDRRVLSLEKTDIRTVNTDMLGGTVDFAAADVSFISAGLILPSVYRLVGEGTFVVLLVKPQFEAGRASIGKHGVVGNPRVHERVISEVCAYAQSSGFAVTGLCYSPIRGGSGNIEYLLALEKNGTGKPADIKKTVEQAFDLL